MQKIKYNNTQINELKAIKYVKNVTEKHIVFTTECKLKVVELSKKWVFSREIFEKLWFPTYVINSEIPIESLKRWKRNLTKKGVIEEKKWKSKKEEIDFENMTKEQYIEYLEAKLALYEEFADYMKKWLP